MNLKLKHAYKPYERAVNNHSSSLYWACYLHEKNQNAARAVYAFCRTVDCTVDASSDRAQCITLLAQASTWRKHRMVFSVEGKLTW